MIPITLLRFTLSGRAKRKSVKRKALRYGNSANLKTFSNRLGVLLKK